MTAVIATGAALLLLGTAAFFAAPRPPPTPTTSTGWSSTATRRPRHAAHLLDRGRAVRTGDGRRPRATIATRRSRSSRPAAPRAVAAVFFVLDAKLGGEPAVADRARRAAASPRPEGGDGGSEALAGAGARGRGVCPGRASRPRQPGCAFSCAADGLCPADYTALTTASVIATTARGLHFAAPERRRAGSGSELTEPLCVVRATARATSSSGRSAFAWSAGRAVPPYRLPRGNHPWACSICSRRTVASSALAKRTSTAPSTSTRSRPTA